MFNSIKSFFIGTAYDIPKGDSLDEAQVNANSVYCGVEVSRAAYENANLNPGQAVYTLASPLKELAPADHIASMKIMADKTVELGTMVLYLYKKEGVVKRVFKIREQQVKDLLRAKKMRYYLTPLKWDANDTNLNGARAQTSSDLERLLTLSAKEANPKRVKQKFAEITHKNAVEMPETPATKKVQASQPVEAVPVTSDLNEAVKRHAKGDEQVGVVAEMGMVDRNNGNQHFKSFCLKIDVHGVIKPSYGVELEREARERGVRAGDTIRLIFMGTEPTPVGFKKLYRIEVLKKGAKA